MLVFGVAGLYSLEIQTGSVYGINMLNNFISNPVAVPIATALAIASIGAVAIVNAPKWSNLNGEEKLLVIGMSVGVLGSWLGPIYAPGLMSPVYNDYTVATLVWGVEAGGYWSLATN